MTLQIYRWGLHYESTILNVMGVEGVHSYHPINDIFWFSCVRMGILFMCGRKLLYDRISSIRWEAHEISVNRHFLLKKLHKARKVSDSVSALFSIRFWGLFWKCGIFGFNFITWRPTKTDNTQSEYLVIYTHIE